MNDERFFTVEEANLLSHAAERWLRLGDVELNPGEHVLALLSRAAVRPRGCTREDIASINQTLTLQLAGYPCPQELTLVRPADADVSLHRVSVLTLLGLSFVGRVVGAVAQLQEATGQTAKARLLAVRQCAALERHRPADRRGGARFLAF